jgi:ABC-type polysaccharide/polyol phosphate export permease
MNIPKIVNFVSLYWAYLRRCLFRLKRLQYPILLAALENFLQLYVSGTLLGGFINLPNFSSFVYPGLLAFAAISVPLTDSAFGVYLQKDDQSLYATLSTPMIAAAYTFAHVTASIIRYLTVISLSSLYYFYKGGEVFFQVEFIVLLLLLASAASLIGIREAFNARGFDSLAVAPLVFLTIINFFAGTILPADAFRVNDLVNNLYKYNPIRVVINLGRQAVNGLSDNSIQEFYLLIFCLFCIVLSATVVVIYEYDNNSKLRN